MDGEDHDIGEEGGERAWLQLEKGAAGGGALSVPKVEPEGDKETTLLDVGVAEDVIELRGLERVESLGSRRSAPRVWSTGRLHRMAAQIGMAESERCS
jgi:hypothetical protein